MSGGILFLAHRLPFPPDRGDKIRSHNVLKALAQLGPVHVGCLAEGEQDFENEHLLEEMAASYWMPPRNNPLPMAGLELLVTRKPVSVAVFRESSLKRWVQQVIEAYDIAAIYVFSGQMGQYIPATYKGRVVLDLVDVDSAKFEAYSNQCRGPKKWLYAREARLLKAFEEQLVHRADTTLLISDAEVHLLRERIAEPGKVRALGNGIDCTHFSPAAAKEDPTPYAGPGPHFVFTGQMDYPPNVDAVTRFAGDILPLIRAEQPDAQFHIVGRAPTPAVTRLGLATGVQVHGAVADMRPYLANAGMIVAPLTIARGVQNKVLEAMAMGRPVLLSPEAATGIPAKHGQHFAICRNDIEFVESALSLVDWPEDAATLGNAARDFVCNAMSWPAMLADLPEILGVEPLPQALERRDAA